MKCILYFLVAICQCAFVKAMIADEKPIKELGYAHLASLVLPGEQLPIAKQFHNHFLLYKADIELFLAPVEEKEALLRYFMLFDSRVPLPLEDRIISFSDLQESNFRSFADRIGTQTLSGTVFKHYLLSHPTNDVNVLNERQDVLLLLSKEHVLRAELQRWCKEIHLQEKSLITFWANQRPSFIKDETYVSESCQGQRALSALTYGVCAAGFIGCLAYAYKLYSDHVWSEVQSRRIHDEDNQLRAQQRGAWYMRPENIALNLRGVRPVVPFHMTPLAPYRRNSLFVQKFGFIPACIAAGMFSLISLYSSAHKNQWAEVFRAKMRPLYLYMRAIRKIHKQITTMPDAAKAMNLPVFTPELEQLWKLLKQAKLKKERAYFASKSALLASYHFFERIKDQLIPFMHKMGEIDTFVALADLIKHQERALQSYCKVTFLEKKYPNEENSDAEKTNISAVTFAGIWSPLFSEQKKCMQSISLNKKTQSALLFAGPHSDGSSYFVRSLLFSVLLAQTCGIAAADTCELTPFDKIIPLLGGECNVPAQECFTCEQQKLKNIREYFEKEETASLSSLLLVDHMFAYEREATVGSLLFEFAHHIVAKPQVVMIMASHFKKPLELIADKDIWLLWHFEIKELAQNIFRKTMKLCPGKNEWWFNDAAKRDRYVKWEML